MLPELYCGAGARVAARLRAQEVLGTRPSLHPDFLAVESEDRRLGIGEVRALILWARYGPVAGSHRVSLVGPAEHLTPEAANALLKLLEEIPPYLLVVLYAEAADRVIPTVRSRCSIHLAPPPQEVWKKALASAGYDPQEIAFLLDLCEEREEELEKFTVARREVFSELKEAEKEGESLSLTQLFLRFPGEAADPLRRRAIAQVILQKLLHAPSFQALEAAEVLARSGGLRDFLWELLRLLRRELEEGKLRYPPALLAAWAQKVSTARAELEANANPQLLAEVVLLWPRKG